VHVCGREFNFLIERDRFGDVRIESLNWVSGAKVRDIITCIPELAEQARKIREGLGRVTGHVSIEIKWYVSSKSGKAERIAVKYMEHDLCGELYVRKGLPSTELKMDIGVTAYNAGISKLKLSLGDQVSASVCATDSDAVNDAVKVMTRLVALTRNLFRDILPRYMITNLDVKYGVDVYVDTDNVDDVVSAVLETIRMVRSDVMSAVPHIAYIETFLKMLLSGIRYEREVSAMVIPLEEEGELELSAKIDMALAFERNGDKLVLVPDKTVTNVTRYEMSIYAKYYVYNKTTDWHFPLTLSFKTERIWNRPSQAATSFSLVLEEPMQFILSTSSSSGGTLAKASRFMYVWASFDATIVFSMLALLHSFVLVPMLIANLSEDDVEIYDEDAEGFMRMLVRVVKLRARGYMGKVFSRVQIVE